MNSPSSDESRARYSRRSLLAAGVAGAVTGVAASSLGGRAQAEDAQQTVGVKNGRINQSVVPWCYKPMSLDELCGHAKRLGLKSVELVQPKDFPVLQKHGLVCAITSSHGFVKGWNDPANHEMCREILTKNINATADANFPAVITFSGMRGELTDEEGKKNMIAGLKTIMGLAEKRGVNVCIEPLNTRVDVEMKGHPGYQCDKIEWAVDICDAIGSPRLKILFDIYHTQIMEGDVIVRINQFKDYVGHYHTAGVPGRNELDDEQELNYPAIMKAIVATGYQGFVGQEFIPKNKDMVASLEAAVQLCDV
ncbi:TIM barrel protein [Blastopirellula sp. JC732]|uniref:TIM barrel protein n=1 Tax=Blastopirellula sediminis TaxID=2894196 RepID=A0A9X1MH83_9BACT|nr:TIM barrel protein [Blastopirellula sediminis]MCC9608184.1 TIM barrel protein [Blastopirellula sediminis]MCC9627023.1 TIM barrel protein [Blastopirellula sediminis]